MLLKFTYGFTHKNFSYGWHKKQLYRLPTTSQGRSFGLKKMLPIRIGNKTGYRLSGDRLTVEQLKAMTHHIEYEVSIIQHEDLPF